jgi:hypothetical protein
MYALSLRMSTARERGAFATRITQEMTHEQGKLLSKKGIERGILLVVNKQNVEKEKVGPLLLWLDLALGKRNEDTLQRGLIEHVVLDTKWGSIRLHRSENRSERNSCQSDKGSKIV